MLAKNADKVDTAIDKAGDIVDKKTQGKYTQHVDKVQDAAKKAVDKNQPAGASDAASGRLRHLRPGSRRRRPAAPTP